jgi:DNA-binding transcriptional LysR family regulator
MPDLRHLRYFVAVAEALSFTKAAERLHIAQPALSATIRQLETELGVELFERTSRRVSLTSSGELLLERARITLASADETFAIGRDAGRGLVGRVRTAVSPAARYGEVSELYAECSSRRPGIAIEIREHATRDVLAAVRGGDADLGIAWCAEGTESLVSERLRDEPLVAYVAEDHRLAAAAQVRVEDLADEPIVVGSGAGSAGFTSALIELLRERGVSPRTVPDPYPDLGLLAAAEGIGVTLGLATQLDDRIRGLKALEVEPALTLPFELVWREENRSPALRVVLETAREVRDSRGWCRHRDP